MGAPQHKIYIKELFIKAFFFLNTGRIFTTKIYHKVDFYVSKHGAVGGTGSEMVVGIWVKVSQYFTIAHRGIYLETPCGHPLSIT